MPIQTVRDILVAAPAVTGLVGARISPNVRAQDEEVPAVTLVLVNVSPLDCLASPPTLEQNIVQVNSWAETYDEAQSVADACRSALEAAGLTLRGQSERYEPAVEEYLVSQEFTLWT